MILGDIQALDIQVPREIAQYWGWFLAFGIALLLLGIAALSGLLRLRSPQCSFSDGFSSLLPPSRSSRP
jgi:hypothetical protein